MCTKTSRTECPASPDGCRHIKINTCAHRTCGCARTRAVCSRPRYSGHTIGNKRARGSASTERNRVPPTVTGLRGRVISSAIHRALPLRRLSWRRRLLRRLLRKRLGGWRGCGRRRVLGEQQEIQLDEASLGRRVAVAPVVSMHASISVFMALKSRKGRVGRNMSGRVGRNMSGRVGRNMSGRVGRNMSGQVGRNMSESTKPACKHIQQVLARHGRHTTTASYFLRPPHHVWWLASITRTDSWVLAHRVDQTCVPDPPPCGLNQPTTYGIGGGFNWNHPPTVLSLASFQFRLDSSTFMVPSTPPPGASFSTYISATAPFCVTRMAVHKYACMYHRCVRV
jgi:hypothetical protein